MDNENVENRLRPMHCELNILTRSDGSAMLTQGLSKSPKNPVNIVIQT